MSPLKSRQFCSVCKQWLEMEVVQTSDGDEDDGVIWFRCPQCQGYLPKLSGADLTAGEEEAAAAPSAAPEDAAAGPASADDDMPWDSPAAMMAAQQRERDAGTDGGVDDALAAAEPDEDVVADDLDDLDDDAAESDADADADAGADKDAAAGEPLAEYAEMLAALDPEAAVPYRPWDGYEVGQGILHLAWDDCGVVVAKEDLPGGRKVIKCYFGDAGVVRLIENAPR